MFRVLLNIYIKGLLFIGVSVTTMYYIGPDLVNV